MKVSLITWGYGNDFDYDRLERVIQAYQVGYVLDVRKGMGGRGLWKPGPLRKKCQELVGAQDAYCRLPRLGNGEHKLPWVRRNGWQLDLLQAAEEVVTQGARERSVMLMCSEREPFEGGRPRCHRVDVAFALSTVLRGLDCTVEVVHLVASE